MKLKEGKQKCVKNIGLSSIDSVNITTKFVEIAVSPDFSIKFSFVLEIYCKTFEICNFCFENEEYARSFFVKLQEHCFNGPAKTFAFFPQRESQELTHWEIFSWDDEFIRLRLDPNSWRTSTANSSFKICESYPPSFIVPAQVSDSRTSFSSSFSFLSLSFPSPPFPSSLSLFIFPPSFFLFPSPFPTFSPSLPSPSFPSLPTTFLAVPFSQLKDRNCISPSLHLLSLPFLSCRTPFSLVPSSLSAAFCHSIPPFQ